MNTQSLTRNRSLKLLLCYLLSLKCCGASDSISCEQRIDNAAVLRREEATEQQQKQEAIKKRDEVIQGQDQRLKKATEVVKRLMNEKAKLETDLKNEEGKNQDEFKACLKELGEKVNEFGTSANVLGQASQNINTAAENMTNAVSELKENKEEFRECAVVFQETAVKIINSNEQQLYALTSAINRLVNSQEKLADGQQKQIDYWTGKFMQKPDNNPLVPQIPYAANQESGQSSEVTNRSIATSNTNKSRRVTSYPKQENISVGNRDVQGLLYPKRVNLINSGALVRNPEYTGRRSSGWNSDQSSVMDSKESQRIINLKSQRATTTVNHPYVEELSSSPLHEAKESSNKNGPKIETPGSSSKTMSFFTSTSILPTGSPNVKNKRKNEMQNETPSNFSEVVATDASLISKDPEGFIRRILDGEIKDGMYSISFKQIYELLKLFGELKRENSRLTSDKLILEEQVTELQDKLNEVSRQRKQRMDSNEDLRSLNADLSNQLENGKKEISRLREENRKLTIEKQSADERAQSLQEKLESYEGKVNRLNRKVSEYKFSFKQLQDATQNLNKKYKERKRELQEKRDEAFSLKTKVSCLEIQVSHLEVLLQTNGTRT